MKKKVNKVSQLPVKTEVKESTSVAVVAAAIEKKAKLKSKKVLDLEIKTQADKELALTTIKAIKEMVKEAEVKEAKILDPLQTAIKETKSLFKPFYESAKLVEKIGKDKILAFDESLLLAAKKIEDDLATGKIKKVSTFMAKMQEVEVTTKGTRITKEIVVEDITKIPREFMVPDMAAIKLAFKEGKPVKGCKEIEKKGLAI